jgi:gluconokinase
MGVSGCGKTTIGALLAARVGWPFIDADALHPPANVAKMSAGIPLTDADRWPWLRIVGAWIAERHAQRAAGIVACSALKRAYRDVLREADPDLKLVYLHGDRTLLLARLAARRGHFFPAALLDAQLADLQVPTPDEHPIIVPIGQSPDKAVSSILGALEPR